MATINSIGSAKPIEVVFGGTGAATLTEYGILLGNGTGAVTAIDAASATTDYVLTAINGSAPTFQAAAGGGIETLDSDSGSATGATVTITGGTNITTSGAAAAITVNLDAALTALTSVTMADTGSIQTTTTDTDTLLIQGYDVDGTAYVPFMTITNANEPTCDLNTGVTLGTKYIYRADGTDVPVADGGTGASTFTDGGLLVGATTGPIEALAVGGVGTILTGVAGANPTWTTASYPSTAAVGTILIASGANVITTLAPDTADYVLTDGGAGVAPSWKAAAAAAYCDDAEAIAGTVTDEAVSPSTLKAKLGTQTDHGLLVGSATTGAITALGVGGVGTILTGVAASDPTWTTASYPATATKGDLICASAANAFTVLTAGTNDYVLTANGSGEVPTWQASSGGSSLTLNDQTGTTYTTVLADAGKLVTLTNASAITLTVPKNSSVAYTIGAQIMLYQGGAGKVTVAPVDGDVTIRSADSLLGFYAQYSTALLTKILEDTWSLSGDLS